VVVWREGEVHHRKLSNGEVHDRGQLIPSMMAKCIASVVRFLSLILARGRVRYHMMGIRIGGTLVLNFENIKIVFNILLT
jgi:hypothetical protein